MYGSSPGLPELLPYICPLLLYMRSSLDRPDGHAGNEIPLQPRVYHDNGHHREHDRGHFQGFGNAGQFIAQLLADDGYSIVAVSDSRGAIHNPHGIDVSKLIALKKETGSVLGVAKSGGAEVIAADDLIAVDCDLLVPAAMEDLIHKGNADRVKASVVLELANGPITPEADAILTKKNVMILPDILANAGGVTVSYFEWVQNRQGFYWPLEEIHARLKTIMESEGEKILAVAAEKEIPLRTAAYVHALSRLANAIQAHGTQSFFVS